MINRYKKGISIAELLVVIAVLGIIFLIVIPRFSKTKELQVLKNGVQDILSSIDKARGETLSSLNSSSYGVRFEADKIIIFTGTSFTPGATGNETVNIITPASITNVALGCTPSIPCNVYFNRLSGAPSTTGTVTVSTTSYSRIITISATGVASSN